MTYICVLGTRWAVVRPKNWRRWSVQKIEGGGPSKKLKEVVRPKKLMAVVRPKILTAVVRPKSCGRCPKNAVHPDEQEAICTVDVR